MIRKIILIIFIAIAVTAPWYFVNAQVTELAGAVAGGLDPLGITRTVAETAAQKVIGASMGSFSETLYQWGIFMYSLIANAILSFASWTLWLAGVCLNLTIKFGIVEMRTYIEKITAIKTSWVFFRDIANMSFIFIILYIAIKTIIGAGSFATKTLLTKVVISAVLINFSLFFTNIAVDSSNILTIGVFNQIQEITKSTKTSNSTQTQASTNQTTTLATQSNISTAMERATNAINSMDGGISGAIMNGLKINTLFSKNTSNYADYVTNFYKLVVITIAGLVLISIADFIIYTIAILFAIRFVYIILVMILAPVAFASAILPKTEFLWSWWKTTLMNQVIFAPVIMTLLYATILITKNIQEIQATTAQNVTWAKILSEPGVIGDALGFGIIWSFMIVSGLFLATIIVAKKAGAHGTDFATGLASQASFGITRLTTKGLVQTAPSLVRAVEAGSKGMSARTGLINKIRGAGMGAVGSAVTDLKKAGSEVFDGSMRKAIAKNITESNYDVRKIGPAGGIEGIVKSTLGVNLGKGAPTAEETEKAKLEELKKILKSMEPSDLEKEVITAKIDSKKTARQNDIKTQHQQAIQALETKVGTEKTQIDLNNARITKINEEIKKIEEEKIIIPGGKSKEERINEKKQEIERTQTENKEAQEKIDNIIKKDVEGLNKKLKEDLEKLDKDLDKEKTELLTAKKDKERYIAKYDTYAGNQEMAATLRSFIKEKSKEKKLFELAAGALKEQEDATKKETEKKATEEIKTEGEGGTK